jgi:hypothetical protein
MRRFGILGVVLLATALSTVPAAEAHKRSFDKPVVETFFYSHQPPSEETVWLVVWGRIEGPRACQPGRTIQLSYVVGETQEVLATTTVYDMAEDYSVWGPAIVRGAPAGTYQATVLRRVVRKPHHIHRCPSGTSAPFTYSPPPPR